MTARDPLNNPAWQAYTRECSLVRQLVGSGVTALGKANYADGEGKYYQAFFGLSVGLERLAKLILVADYAMKNGGQLPSAKFIRGFGHEIEALLDKVDSIAEQHNLALNYQRPEDEVCKAIISCLASFADASRGRYANLEALGNPNFEKEFEPLSKWWNEVAELILKKHYYGSKVEQRIKHNADMVDLLLGGRASVLHRNEIGEWMEDVGSASLRTGQTRIVQKHSRYYALLIVRWMCDLFRELSHIAVYNKNIDILFGHYEIFQTYTVDDEFLKTRKNWPLV